MSLNLSENTNIIVVTESLRRILITTNEPDGININIPQNVTNILRVSSPGPIGPAGDAPSGAFIGSYTGSFSGSMIGSGIFTGSFFGTASYAISSSQAFNAINALSASYILIAESASYVQNAESASFVVLAQSASYVELARTASYVENAETASFVELARSASYVLLAQSSSRTISGSFSDLARSSSYSELARSSSFSQLARSSSTSETASFIRLAVSASYVQTAQTASFTSFGRGTFTGSFSGSLVGTASWASNAVSASFAALSRTASFAITSSFVQLAQSASYSLFAVTASHALNGGGTSATASFALTASFVQNGGSGSFSGSFEGDGSNLTGIVSSKWSGSSTISREGNVEITGSLNVTQGITASLFGTASTALYVPVFDREITDTTFSLVQTDDRKILYVLSESIVNLPADLAANFTCTLVNVSTGSVILNPTGTLEAVDNVLYNRFTAATLVYKSSSWEAWGALGTGSSFILSSSFADNARTLDLTGSLVFATTGSNRFKGNQIITGSLFNRFSSSNDSFEVQDINGSTRFEILYSGSVSQSINVPISSAASIHKWATIGGATLSDLSSIGAQNWHIYSATTSAKLGNIAYSTPGAISIATIYQNANSSSRMDMAFYTASSTNPSGALNIYNVNTAATRVSFGMGTTGVPLGVVHIRGAGTTTFPIFYAENSGQTVRFVVLDTGSVGINTSTPTASLDIVSRGTGADDALRIRNSSLTDLFVVNDNGSITGSRMMISSSNSQSFMVYGSGSNIFSVYGSAGLLFSISDGLSGSLFSISNQSGLPILEVLSDETILIGDWQAPALHSSKKTTLNSGSTNIFSALTSSYDGMWIDYTVKSGSNVRAGQMMGVWSGSQVNYTETTTTEFGSTSNLSLMMRISGSHLTLTGSSTTNGWTLKTIIRSI